ncbi:MAG TPA: hypothetical protein PLM71_07640 [Syntrophorhabdaceae bacterium]|nr:hypothetical protein [Syntrophorhabdaceae bacterium]HPU30178.1 hypothetical protein [Syntrophorhabdaceae bacterium]
MDREEELKSQGWEKRFIACEPRLTEMVDLYREIGFEVLLEPLPLEDDMEKQTCVEKECTVCYQQNREKYRIIYTRQKISEK